MAQDEERKRSPRGLLIVGGLVALVLAVLTSGLIEQWLLPLRLPEIRAVSVQPTTLTGLPPAPPTPATPQPPPAPSVSPSPLVTLPRVTPGTPTPSSSCPSAGMYNPKYQVPLQITTRGNTMIATWPHTPGTGVQSYEVGWHLDWGTAAQRAAPIAWRTVAAPAVCQIVTVTFTGLAPGNYHLFVLMNRADGPGGSPIRAEAANSFFAIT